MFFLLCFSWIRQGLFLVLRDFQGLTQVIIPQDEVSATKTRVCVFIFPLVAWLQQPQRERRTLSNSMLCLTSRLKCCERPDLTLQQKLQCCFHALRVILSWGAWPQCLCAVLWISVRLCPLPAGTFPREGAAVQRPCGVCGASDWDSVPSAPGAAESGEDGLGGLSGLSFLEGNSPGWWDYGVRALPWVLVVWQPILR